MFVEFREDEIYNHYENRHYPVTELTGMHAVVTTPLIDRTSEVANSGSRVRAGRVMGLRLDNSTTNSVSASI